MSKAPGDTKSDDEAAFATFTKNLAQAPKSATARTASKRRGFQGWPTLIVSSLVIAACATAGALAAHSYGWSDGLKIAASALVGGPFGACAGMAVALLLALRLANRHVTDLGETGTYNDMPGFLVPVVWAVGYAGAVGGSALFAGVAVHLATRSSDQQFLFRPPTIGGAIGAVLCAVVVGGIAAYKATQAPRTQDRVQQR
jgi:hypothetical protein